MPSRPIQRLIHAVPTIEGAGVRLRRAFGFGSTADFDPFLLFDDFRGERPEDYAAGFPWHPHRGMETITYVLAGSVEHQDSMGNRGRIGAGDVQWMTAGRGIIHQEMPQGDAAGRMHGFQLWANLPSHLKLTAPRYQEVKAADIPEVVDRQGVRVRVVCGRHGGERGPIDGIAAAPGYLDVAMPAKAQLVLPVETARHAFAYVFAGSGSFGDAATAAVADNRSLLLFGPGDEVTVEAGPEGVRFLLVSGMPLRQPVAWRGPIVMNSEAELLQAFEQLERGTFLEAMAS